MKIDAPLVILLITIASAIAAYWSNVDSNKQLDRMEQYDSLNNKLGNEIKSLSELNNSIGKRIDTIVSENQSLAKQNIVLTNQANELITEVKKLTFASNMLIENVDLRTHKFSRENELTGELDFEIEKKLEDTEVLSVRIGGLTIGNYVKKYKSANPPTHILLDNKEMIPFKIVDGKLKISFKAYDLDGNLLVEVQDNVWRRNSNSAGKFNYDSKGFEIIDNKGLTVLNINFESNTNLSIEGYFYDVKSGIILVYGKNSFQSLPISNSLKTIIKTIEKARIRRLFDYSGKNWTGKRIGKN